MMYKLGQFVILLCVIHLIVCPPVTEKPAEEEKTDKPTATDEEAVSSWGISLFKLIKCFESEMTDTYHL